MSSRLNPRDYDLGELRAAVREGNLPGTAGRSDSRDADSRREDASTGRVSTTDAQTLTTEARDSIADRSGSTADRLGSTADGSTTVPSMGRWTAGDRIFPRRQSGELNEADRAEANSSGVDRVDANAPDASRTDATISDASRDESGLPASGGASSFDRSDADRSVGEFQRYAAGSASERCDDHPSDGGIASPFDGPAGRTTESFDRSDWSGRSDRSSQRGERGFRTDGRRNGRGDARRRNDIGGGGDRNRRRPIPARPGFERVSAEVGGSSERPYLDRLPASYASQSMVFDWLEGMVTTSGWAGTREALAYYESIGWLSGSAREELEAFLEGLASLEPDDCRPLAVDDHRESLRYVARLSGRSTD